MGELSIGHDVDLQDLNTLAIPAKAAYCGVCRSLEDLQQCLGFADKHQLKVMVLGEGSNTVFTKDYDGMVILNRLRGISVIRQDETQIEIKVKHGY